MVAVGHPQSEEKQLQWRLSFSAAEKLLCHSMTDKMAGCIYALKALKPKLEKGVNQENVTLICSYFLKTACFWVFENIHVDEESSITHIVSEILDWLLLRYQAGNLERKFIPKKNLIGHIAQRRSDMALLIEKLHNCKIRLQMFILEAIPLHSALLKYIETFAAAGSKFAININAMQVVLDAFVLTEVPDYFDNVTEEDAAWAAAFIKSND